MWLNMRLTRKLKPQTKAETISVNMNKDGSLFAGGWSNPSGITYLE